MNELTIVKEWSVEDIKTQVGKVQALVKGVLIEKQHYGKIPGTDKPTLLKPGAEKLCLMFRLAPKYDIESIKHDDGHIEFRITCSLYQIGSDSFWGQGVGSCSTLESKYRYRNDYEDTGKPVPRSYWENRDIKLIGGKGFVVKKDGDGAWKIFKQIGKIENPDIADQYNTVLKMAKKRAMVDATITATGASDIFIQDMEDFTKMVEPVKDEAEKFDTEQWIDDNPDIYNRIKGLIAGELMTNNDARKMITDANGQNQVIIAELDKLGGE